MEDVIGIAAGIRAEDWEEWLAWVISKDLEACTGQTGEVFINLKVGSLELFLSEK